MEENQNPMQNPAPPTPAPKPKKPVYKRVWFWLIIVFAALVLLVVIAGGGKGDQGKAEEPAQTASQTEQRTAVPAATEAAVKTDYEVGEGIVKLWTDSIGSTWVSAAVPVKNTGTTNLYLSSATIDLEKADGSLAASMSMVNAYPQVLKPGETAWYYNDTTYDGNASDALTAVPHPQVEEAKVDCVRLNTSDITLSDDEYTGLKIIGRVENQTEAEQSLVYVTAALYDQNGACLGVAFTILTDPVKPGEKISFSMGSLASRISASDVASYEVFAYPNQMQF